MANLTDFIVSRTRVRLIQIFLENPKEMYHVREIVRRSGEEINSVRRELLRMEEAGMAKKETRGNRVYYWFNLEYPFFQELLSLVCKTTGLGFAIRKNKGKLGRINFVVFTEEFVKNTPAQGKEDVDVLIIGEVVLPELASLIRQEEQKRGREINYTPMSKEEFEFRKKRRDPFVLSLLTKSRIMVLGDEDDFVSQNK